jgi:hypothetical protein
VHCVRALLDQLIVSLEIGKGQGKVKYTFPLTCADLYAVPPGEREQQDRTGSCYSPYDTTFRFYDSLSPARVTAEW